MKATDLLKIGFKDTSNTELGIDGNFMPLHNVTTPEQIEQLIKLLTL